MGTETIPYVLFFENHAGQVAYDVLRRLDDPDSVKFSDLKGTLDNLRGEFEDELLEKGSLSQGSHALLET